MKVFKSVLASFIIFPLTASLAFSYVYGGSNLGYGGYPSHYCTKPYKPYSFETQYEVDSYNMEVQIYIDCINEYVGNARNDIDRITEQANQAINEANN